ncbi:MAG: SpoIIE family protein phosphatase, partial [Polyangiaceae bacterium]
MGNVRPTRAVGHAEASGILAAVSDGAHIEVAFEQHAKNGQILPGDVFVSRRIKEEDRIVSVISDGLGSGVKANVLATLTATMSLKYAASFQDVRKSAETIMSTLPVCSVRKISYSTFTIVDVDGEGHTRVIEHGNPPFALVRREAICSVPTERIGLERWPDRPIAFGRFRLELGDRLVIMSDGVTQSGMGQRSMPLGWGDEAAACFIVDAVRRDPTISARRLARLAIDRAMENDGGFAKDDISCAVLSYRMPRRLLVASGPPFARERDDELADLVAGYAGRTAVCGGTTARIIGRALHRTIHSRIESLDSEIPPSATMEGVDLVTEGTLTLARAAELLDGAKNGPLPKNPAGELVELMLDSDVVDFVIGTRINEAHQDPNIPVELDLRR